MGEIGQIFLNLGEYSGPILIGLLVGVWLFGRFLKLNLKEKRKRNLQDARDIIILKSEIHIMSQVKQMDVILYCTGGIHFVFACY